MTLRVIHSFFLGIWLVKNNAHPISSNISNYISWLVSTMVVFFFFNKVGVDRPLNFYVGTYWSSFYEQTLRRRKKINRQFIWFAVLYCCWKEDELFWKYFITNCSLPFFFYQYRTSMQCLFSIVKSKNLLRGQCNTLMLGAYTQWDNFWRAWWPMLGACVQRGLRGNISVRLSGVCIWQSNQCIHPQ